MYAPSAHLKTGGLYKLVPDPTVTVKFQRNPAAMGYCGCIFRNQGDLGWDPTKLSKVPSPPTGVGHDIASHASPAARDSIIPVHLTVFPSSFLHILKCDLYVCAMNHFVSSWILTWNIICDVWLKLLRWLAARNPLQGSTVGPSVHTHQLTVICLRSREDCTVFFLNFVHIGCYFLYHLSDLVNLEQTTSFASNKCRKQKKYLWWSLGTLYLLACQVRVMV